MSDDLDFRVSCGLFDHPKFMRLDAALGDRGGMALFRLWRWTRLHRPNGDLSGLTDAEIASAARWKGRSTALLDVLAPEGGDGFLEGVEGSRRAHGWLERQAHAAHSGGIRRAQRLRALERWSKESGLSTEAYVDRFFGLTVDAYLNTTEPPKRVVPGTPNGDAGHMPPHDAGQSPAYAGRMPASSSPLPSPPLPPVGGTASSPASFPLGPFRAAFEARWFTPVWEQDPDRRSTSEARLLALTAKIGTPTALDWFREWLASDHGDTTRVPFLFRFLQTADARLSAASNGHSTDEPITAPTENGAFRRNQLLYDLRDAGDDETAARKESEWRAAGLKF